MTDAEIVRAVAVSVMGWEQRPEKSVSSQDNPDNPVWCDETGYYQDHVWRWNPLASDVDACAVLDKMAQQWYIQLDVAVYPKQARCQVMRPEDMELVGEEINPCRRRVICIAALKAVGAWIDDG